MLLIWNYNKLMAHLAVNFESLWIMFEGSWTFEVNANCGAFPETCNILIKIPDILAKKNSHRFIKLHGVIISRNSQSP
jgi:hypothetical protein